MNPLTSMSRSVIAAVAMSAHATVAYAAADCPGRFGVRDIAPRSQDLPSADRRPIHPEMTALISNVVKSYACQLLINDFAEDIGLGAVKVKVLVHPTEAGVVHIFGHEFDGNVCGTIRFDRSSLAAAGTDAKDVAALEALRGDIYAAFEGLIGHLRLSGLSLAQRYQATGVNYPRPQFDHEANYVRRLNEMVSQLYTKTLGAEPRSRVTERFSSVKACAGLLPVASGPNMERFWVYGQAFTDYQTFAAKLDAGLKQELAD